MDHLMLSFFNLNISLLFVNSYNRGKGISDKATTKKIKTIFLNITKLVYRPLVCPAQCHIYIMRCLFFQTFICIAETHFKIQNRIEIRKTSTFQYFPLQSISSKTDKAVLKLFHKVLCNVNHFHDNENFPSLSLIWTKYYICWCYVF